ncbi:MAG: ABC transporter ATP-binding protein [Myxococcales bacterium]
MATVELRGLRKEIAGTPIVRGIDLSIADGELLVLVGPSGCSKTTLLRLISGLEEPTAGEIWIGGRRVDALPPAQRDVAMVFQSYALYPHMTVRQNLEFGLVLRKVARAEIDRRVEEVAGLLELSALLARRPRELSGGQRQRVAMGRAIVRRPAVFLFDEPLSNLDASLRSQVRLQLQKLHRQIGTTSVYVTHDQIEAMTLADRLAVLRAGELQQIGPPLEVYRQPANRFVAGFLGNPAVSFLRATARRQAVGFRAEGSGFALAISDADGLRDGAQLWLGLRPQDLAFVPAAPEALRGTVEATELIGWEAFVQVRVGDASLAVRTEASAAARLAAGQTVHLTIPRDAVLLFDAESERALPKAAVEAAARLG